MTALLFIIGLISILGQVVLLRELNVASFGVELVYILALGFWLAATALGALSCRSSRAPRPDLLTIPLLLFAALLPLAVAFARGSRVLAGGVPGAYLPFGEQIITIGITLLPAGFLTGWLFRRAAGILRVGGKDRCSGLCHRKRRGDRRRPPVVARPALGGTELRPGLDGLRSSPRRQPC